MIEVRTIHDELVNNPRFARISPSLLMRLIERRIEHEMRIAHEMRDIYSDLLHQLRVHEKSAQDIEWIRLNYYADREDHWKLELAPDHTDKQLATFWETLRHLDGFKLSIQFDGTIVFKDGSWLQREPAESVIPFIERREAIKRWTYRKCPKF